MQPCQCCIQKFGLVNDFVKIFIIENFSKNEETDN